MIWLEEQSQRHYSNEIVSMYLYRVHVLDGRFRDTIILTTFDYQEAVKAFWEYFELDVSTYVSHVPRRDTRNWL